MAAAVAMAFATQAQAAVALRHSESFSLTSSVVYDQSQMYRPEFYVGPAQGGPTDFAFNGRYVGSNVAPADRQALALPGFDPALGSLQSIAFEISWRAVATSGTLNALPKGFGGVSSLRQGTDIETALSIDGVGVANGTVSAQSSCFAFNAFGEMRTCQDNDAEAAILSQTFVVVPGSGHPISITEQPLQIELFRSHTTYWDSSVLSVPGFIGRNVSRLDWDGTVSVAYSYTPFATPGVPEPASWALLILGFGAVGGALRRRAALPNGNVLA